VIKEIRARLGYLVFKEIRVSEEIEENQEKKVSRASKVFPEFREFRAIKEKKERLDHRATKEIRVSVGTKEIRVKLVHQVIRVRGAIKVKKESLEVLVSQVNQVRRV
jgi:hypothetical protein